MAYAADWQEMLDKLRTEVLQWHTHPGMAVQRGADDVDQIRAREVQGIFEDWELARSPWKK